MVNPRRAATTARKATPWRRRFTRSVRSERVIALLPRDPDGRVGAPQSEAEEQVDHVDRDDRRANGTTDGDTDTRGTTTREVAVVAVDQHDHDREDDDLEERVEDVDGHQELMEVVVV